MNVEPQNLECRSRREPRLCRRLPFTVRRLTDGIMNVEPQNLECRSRREPRLYRRLPYAVLPME